MKLRPFLLLALPFTSALAQQAPARAWTPLPPTPVDAPDAPPAPAAPAVAWAPLAQRGLFDDFKVAEFQARFPQDPADSVYREARSLLNRGEWRRAARMFADVAGRTPQSRYAADALYWQAFSLYRIGNTADLREARTALESRKSRFPSAGSSEEAESLIARINGALASRGDAAAQAALRDQANRDAGTCDSEELSVRASALNTLMHNDPAAAMPILAKVLDRRDECSVSLRRNAVMIIGTKGDAQQRARLNDVIARDPNMSVRSDAIGYVAQANTDAAAGTLDGIVRNDTSLTLRRSAVRALGTMSVPAAKSAIKALVERTAAPERLRLDAIQTFDRRAGFSYAYACDGNDCTPRAMALRPGQTAYAYDGQNLVPLPVTPVPATPMVAPAPMAPMAPPAPVAVGGFATTEARAEARAAAAAQAAANADARAAARETARALTVAGQGARWDDEDRRISPEDAAWLRGVYPRLETTRLKTAAAAVLARATDEPTRTWLGTMVGREEEPAEVRNTILQRLGRELPIAALARLYDNASSRSARQEVVELLGQRAEPEATDKLIEIVKTGTDPQLRRAAISALNSKKDPRTTQLLLELIDK